MATPYSMLMDAGRLVIDIESIVANLDRYSPNAVEILARNREALDLAREVPLKSCAVPIRYEKSFWGEHVDVESPLRNLACAFRLEAEVARQRNDLRGAVGAGKVILQLACAVRRGGLVLDLLLSQAVLSMAIDALRQQRARYDQPSRIEIVAALMETDAELEPFNLIVNRDREWERIAEYEEEPHDFLATPILSEEECGLSEAEQKEWHAILKGFSELPEGMQAELYGAIEHREVAMLRLLAIDTAIRLFQDRMGHLPDELSVLSPTIMPDVPIDPFTGRDFVYAPGNDGMFALYSPGPNCSEASSDIAGCTRSIDDNSVLTVDYWENAWP